MKFQITFRESADKDLIKWYNATVSGDRAHIIREALRQYLKNKDGGRQKTRASSNALNSLEL